MKKIFIIGFSFLSLISCANMNNSGVVSQPPNPKIIQEIISACEVDGVFKNFGGRLVLQSLPYIGMADQLIAIGVDKVCENPEKFANDIYAASWVILNIRSVMGRK